MMESPKVTVEISTRTLLSAVVVVLLLAMLYIIRDILLVMIVSVILASALDPFVEWLFHKAKFPRGLSVILVYLVFLSSLVGAIYYLTPPVVQQFNQLSSRFSDVRAALENQAGEVTEVLRQLGIGNAISALGEYSAQFTTNFFQQTLGVLSGMVQVIVVLVLTFYLISSESGMKNFIKTLVPFKHQAYAIHLTEKIQKKMGQWLLGQLILSGFIFLFTFVGLELLGVKNALALALLAGLLEIIPYLGPILSAVPAVLVAFVHSPTQALFVVLLYVIIQQAENYILLPKVMGRTVGANPLVILLAVLIGFKFAGITGILVSVPIVAAIQVFISDFRETVTI